MEFFDQGNTLKAISDRNIRVAAISRGRGAVQNLFGDSISEGTTGDHDESESSLSFFLPSILTLRLCKRVAIFFLPFRATAPS